MIKVHSSPIAVEVHNLCNVLEQSGIKCEVHGENLNAGLGGIPAVECWVELWILDDTQQQAAEQILAEASRTSAAKPWKCPQCGESVGGEFTICWNCQGSMPS